MVTTHKIKGCKHKTKIKKCSKGIKKRRKYYTQVGNLFDGHREFPYACMIWLISSKHEHSRLISLLKFFTENVDLFVVRIAVSCTLPLVPHIHWMYKQVDKNRPQMFTNYLSTVNSKWQVSVNEAVHEQGSFSFCQVQLLLCTYSASSLIFQHFTIPQERDEESCRDLYNRINVSTRWWTFVKDWTTYTFTSYITQCRGWLFSPSSDWIQQQPESVCNLWLRIPRNQRPSSFTNNPKTISLTAWPIQRLQSRKTSLPIFDLYALRYCNGLSNMNFRI